MGRDSAECPAPKLAVIFLQICAELMSMEPVSKFGESHLESHLKRTPTFEWRAVRCGSKSRHRKGKCVWMWLQHVFRSLLTILNSVFNIMGIPIRSFKEGQKRIFGLILYKTIFIWAPKIMSRTMDIILHWFRVSYPTRSGLRAKSARPRLAHLNNLMTSGCPYVRRVCPNHCSGRTRG